MTIKYRKGAEAPSVFCEVMINLHSFVTKSSLSNYGRFKVSTGIAEI